MKKRYILIITFGLISILTGCQSKNADIDEVSTVNEIKVNENSVMEVDGVVTTEQDEELYINFATTIKNIYVKDGEIVKKGTPLFELDLSEYRNEIKSKEQEIAVLQTELKQIEQGVDSNIEKIQSINEKISAKENLMSNENNVTVKELKNKLAIAKQDLETLNNMYSTNKELNEEGAISNQEVDKSYKNVQAKEKEIENLNLQIQKNMQDNEESIREFKLEKRELEAQLDKSNSDINASIEVKKLQIKGAQMALEQLKEKYNSEYIKENSIIATSDNVIIYDIACTVGSKIPAGGKMIAKMMSANKKVVSIDIPVENLMSVKVGSKVDIEVYDNQKETISGEVIRISDRAVEVDEDSIVRADVNITEGADLLKIGSKVDASIHLEN